jgi:hypothetical protein
MTGGRTLTVLAALGALLGPQRRCAAQELALKLDLEYPSVLQYEAVNVFLHVRNESDTALIIEEGAEWNSSHLTFSVMRDRRTPVAVTGTRPLVTRLRVEPDQGKQVFADISESFDMVTPGKYSVAARVDWNGQTIESESRVVEVVRGIELTNVRRAVPGYPDLTRKYSLRYWPRAGTEWLFLTVDEEPTGMNYGVFALGKLVRVVAPVVKVDRMGKVVVVHQSGAQCMTRSVFVSTRQGVQGVDQTYHLPSGEPYPFVRDRQTPGPPRPETPGPGGDAAGAGKKPVDLPPAVP